MQPEGKSQWKGFQQARKVSKPKKVLYEVYDNVVFQFKKREFKDAILGIFISAESSKSRRQAKNDSVLKFLGGLCAKDETRRPLFASAMHEVVPEGSILSYMMPEDKDNRTVITYSDGQTNCSCPGAWCMQIASATTLGFEATTKAFFDYAILISGGWTQIPDTKLIQRFNSSSGKASDGWWEQMHITLAPRGAFRGATADLLHKFLKTYSFLHWDGCMAFAPTTLLKRCCSFDCVSRQEAEETIKRRDFLVVQDYKCSEHDQKVKGTRENNVTVVQAETLSQMIEKAAFRKQNNNTSENIEIHSDLRGRMTPDGRMRETVIADVFLVEVCKIRQLMEKEYDSAKHRLVPQRKWSELRVLKNKVLALDAALIPTSDEIHECQRDSDVLEMQQKMKNMIVNTSSEDVARLVFAFYIMIGGSSVWTKFVSEYEKSLPSCCDRELAVMTATVDNIINGYATHVTEVILHDLMPKYVRKYGKAVYVLQNQQTLAIEAGDWEQAEQIDVMRKELKKNDSAELLRNRNSSKFGEFFEDAVQLIAQILSSNELAELTGGLKTAKRQRHD